MESLEKKKVAILSTHGYEKSELEEPLKALREAGAEVHVLAPREAGDSLRAWSDGDWSDGVPVDRPVEESRADEYDALVLPGGVINADALRTHQKAVEFTRGFFEQHKPVASICHGPWMLVEAGVADGREMTSYHAIKTDLKNAGALWKDAEVVVDHGLVTSRHPGDLPAFIRKTVEEIGEGKHRMQTA